MFFIGTFFRLYCLIFQRNGESIDFAFYCRCSSEHRKIRFITPQLFSFVLRLMRKYLDLKRAL
ncbi:hypothetical protein [Acinetobacter phage Ab69]|nr:hypothetical protein [Acinetobacter phage Ab69]